MGLNRGVDILRFISKNPAPLVVQAAYKRVKGGELVYNLIDSEEEALQLRRVISGLPAGAEKPLGDLSPSPNVSKWVRDLLSRRSGDSRRELELLLNDFTGALRSRMRERDKYAVAILFPGELLLLAHSVHGEATVTPQWRIYPRLLDSGNVLRHVTFRVEEGGVKVAFYERYKSRSMAEWLGLSPLEVFHYYGGRYRIYFELEGYGAVLELNDEEAESFLEKFSSREEWSRGVIKLTRPLTAVIVRRIVVGKNLTLTPGGFVEYFYRQRYNLERLEAEYQRIVSSLNPLLGRVYDERHRVVLVRGDGGEEVLLKKRYEGVDIVFATPGKIVLREDYVTLMAGELLQGELRLLHVAYPISREPTRLDGLVLLNGFEAPEAAVILARYAEDASDPFIRAAVLAAMMLVLAGVLGPGLRYVLEELSRAVLGLVEEPGSLQAPENEILEYKSADFLSRSLVDKGLLLEDVERKLSRSPVKIYLFGVEDDGRVMGVPASRLRSDVLGGLEEAVRRRGVDVHVALVGREKRILLLVVRRREKDGGF